MQLQSPFRRKPAPVEPTEAAEADAAEETARRSRAYTVSKREQGKVTPKRKAGGRKVQPPPANRREAMKRMREQQRQARAEARAGMLAGDEKYLPARDRGPERRLVRDIVDARRNALSYMLFLLLFVMLVTYSVPNPAMLLYVNMLFYVVILVVVVDSFLLTRRIRKIMLKRFPKATRSPRSHYFYAISRALQIRRFRIPAPVVKLGDQVG